MSDLDDLQQRTGEWGERTFPHSTRQSILAHLREEVDELASMCDPTMDGAMAAEEAADCLLLLLGLAHRSGFSLIEEAERKFAVNQQRTWKVTAPGGYTKHDEGRP